MYISHGGEIKAEVSANWHSNKDKKTGKFLSTECYYPQIYKALSCKVGSSAYLEVDFGSLRQSPHPTKTALIWTENAVGFLTYISHKINPENK